IDQHRCGVRVALQSSEQLRPRQRPRLRRDEPPVAADNRRQAAGRLECAPGELAEPFEALSTLGPIPAREPEQPQPGRHAPSPPPPPPRPCPPPPPALGFSPPSPPRPSHSRWFAPFSS